MDKELLIMLTAAFTLRIGFIIYGEWQDTHMEVKFTDIDYHVFTDAAKFITKGESPYRRATYRYTPILAWILTLNIYISSVVGKLLFVFCDLLSGYIIYQILDLKSLHKLIGKLLTSVWLFNPLTITVSTRGNAESIMSALVLGTIWCLLYKQTICSAILFATSVHFKIYPATYSLPIYLALDHHYIGKNRHGNLLKDILPNKERLKFFIVSGVVFFTLTGISYLWYGFEFLDETYLYHVTRKDIRHNFSVYFYMLYLTAQWQQSNVLALCVFLPQMLLLIVSAFKFYDDLSFCCFIHTFLFVTFNKVCTSQYFLWYLCLLPLIVPSLKISGKSAAFMISSWLLGQAIWLVPAYFLEFRGQNTFIYVWAAGVLFFIINIAIVYKLIVGYHPSPMFHKGKIVNFNQNINDLQNWWMFKVFNKN